MSPLWSGKNTKQSERKAKPSPTYHDNFPDSAQDLGIFTNSRHEVCLTKDHSIEESSPLMSQQSVRAGMTVEAALVLPLILFFILNIGSVIEMIRLHGNLQLALWEVGNQAAIYAYALERGVTPKEEDSWWEEFGGSMLTGTFLKWQLLNAVGETYLTESPMVGGSDGMLMWESDIVKENGEMEIIVTYGVRPFCNFLGVPYFRMANRYYGHAWNGFGPEESSGQETVQVYITDNAEVYHLYLECTHLLLSVRQIHFEEVGDARNLYGGRYSACEKCAEGNMPLLLFVADEGDRYHYLRECPGLKRTIHVVAFEDVADLPLCSRCGAGKE